MQCAVYGLSTDMLTPHPFNLRVWGCMSAAGTGKLQFIEGTMNGKIFWDILKQSMIPSLRKLGRRAVFKHDNTPPRQRCLNKGAEGKSDGLAKHVSRPKPYWAPVGVPVATCEALVNSMPKRVIAVLKSNGGHKNIDTWAQFRHFHLGVYWLTALRVQQKSPIWRNQLCLLLSEEPFTWWCKHEIWYMYSSNPTLFKITAGHAKFQDGGLRNPRCPSENMYFPL